MTLAPGAGGSQESIVAAARIWADNGCSIVPIRADGTKKPACEWKVYQQRQPDTGEMRKWWHPEDRGTQQLGIGIVCGKVSGDLEMLELEGRATSEQTTDALFDKATELGVADLLDQLFTGGYCEITPSGGLHFLYRITDHEVPGNTKVARRPATAEELVEKPDDKIKVLAETRGEGGYVIVAPTGGTVHPTGGSWECVAGQIGHIPEVSWEQRNLLIDTVHAVLDEMPTEEPRERPRPVERPQTTGALRPGDDFNERADWSNILRPRGWTVHHRQGDTVYWTRPGKAKRDGHSATTGHAGVGARDRLYVMSSATEFDTDVPMSKFYVYAYYEHGGNFAEATKALAAQGYGTSNVDSSGNEPLPTAAKWDGGDWASDSYHPELRDTHGTKPAEPQRLREPGLEHYTDVGMANRFIRLYPQYMYVLGYQGSKGTWLKYTEGLWCCPDEAFLEIDKHLETMVDKLDMQARKLLAADADDKDSLRQGKEIAAFVKSARSDRGRKGFLSTLAAKLSISINKFDANPHLLGLNNGVLDTRTGEVSPHSPLNLLTRKMPVTYNPDATAPRTERYMAEVLPDPAYRDFVQRGLGYTLTGEQNQRAFFILHGAPGTGKSQFLELFHKFFGDFATSAPDGAFRKKSGGGAGPTAELHSLQGARYVFASESDEDVVFDADVVKRICGGDTMSTRTLYQSTMTQWRAQCVVWLATNHFPRFPADEEAVWDRVKAIPFDTVFPKGERVGSISDELWREEASGILNLMISWLRDYRAKGLEEPEVLVTGVAARQDEVNPVKGFWDEMTGSGEIIANEDAEIPFTALYQHFCSWYHDAWGLRPMGSRRFGRLLKNVVGYVDVRRSNGKTYLPGWQKNGYNGMLGRMF